MTANATDRARATERRPPRTAGSARAALLIALVGAAGVVTYVVMRPKAPAIRPRPVSTAAATAPLPQMAELGPLVALRAAGGGGAAFDAKALDHVLAAIAVGSIPSRAALPVSLASVATLDGADAPGRIVDVEGVVRSLDREKFSSTVNVRWDQLWAFALEDSDGHSVVVVHPGTAMEPDEGRPVPTRGGEPLADGDRFRVRGVVVQRRTGSIGSIALSTPTPVVAGQEYRRIRASKPAPKTIRDVPWSEVDDRFMDKTRQRAESTQWAAIAWERTVGHRAIYDDLVSGAIAATPWTGGSFRRWMEELSADDDRTAPDPRSFTRASRGRVFVLTGEFADALDEDWHSVPDNEYGVDAHTTYWILSDHYRSALPLFSAFPQATFPDVRTSSAGVKPRVRVFAAFLRNYSFTPKSSTDEITVPSFVLLHLEPK